MKSFDKINFLYLLSSLVLFTAIVLLVWFGYQYYFVNRANIDLALTTEAQNSEQTKCDYQRKLDGVCVDSADKINPKLVGVMIENHLDARPQSGLAGANVVYEAPVEANYTRFLAIFSADLDIKKVGPVRSARPYYLDWLSEYGALPYLHCGGSPDALSLIKKRNIFDLNEFYNGWYYWRADDRSAPHNVYTSSDLWSKAFDRDQGDWSGWKFNTSTNIEQILNENLTNIKQITISFLPPVYEAVWKYNSSTNQFDRYQMGSRHCDADGKCISTDNVIVMNVDKKVLDEIGRLQIITIGQGEATVFKDGIDYVGTWIKTGVESRTGFYDVNGEEIKLNPGKIWIELVPEDGSVKTE